MHCCLGVRGSQGKDNLLDKYLLKQKHRNLYVPLRLEQIKLFTHKLFLSDEEMEALGGRD